MLFRSTGKEILVALRKKIPAEEFLRRYNGDLREEIKKVDETNQNVKDEIREIYKNIKGTKSALLLDSKLDVIRRVGIREAAKTVENYRRDVFAVILDGTVTSNLVKTCEEKGVKYLGATNFSNVGESNVKLVSL